MKTPYSETFLTYDGDISKSYVHWGVYLLFSLYEAVMMQTGGFAPFLRNTSRREEQDYMLFFVASSSCFFNWSTL